VTKNNHPLRINIGFLLNQAVGTSRDFDFDFETITLPPDLELSDFSGSARVTRTRQGLLVEGAFTGVAALECVRCLGEAEATLHTEYQELYGFKNHPISESGLIVPDDGYIDLGPMTAEYLILEIPISPLCSEDCKGLCSICGVDLNTVTSDHVHSE
jgi:uncharacterized protein